MIEYSLDAANSILVVRPKSVIEKDDFTELTKAVDAHTAATGDLAGVIIDAPTFPGWHSFGAMVNHFHFVRDHHERVKKVALVTDSHIGDVAEHLASHFVSASVRHFSGGQFAQAQEWIIGSAPNIDRPRSTAGQQPT